MAVVLVVEVETQVPQHRVSLALTTLRVVVVVLMAETPLAEQWQVERVITLVVRPTLVVLRVVVVVVSLVKVATL